MPKILKPGVILPTCTLLALLVVGGWAWFAGSPSLDSSTIPRVPPPPPNPTLLADLLAPHLQQLQIQNADAADRCIDRIRQHFRSYREHSPAFAEDLTSFSTRWQVLKRMPFDWWNRSEDVEAFITQKFEEHFFSHDSLESTIQSSLAEFKQDLHGNRNSLLASVKATFAAHQLPEHLLPNAEHYESLLHQSLIELASRNAEDSVYAGLTSLLVSEVGASLSVGILSRLLTSLGTNTLATTALSGSVTAGAATTGAGGGSSVGPAGTIIGLAVGLVVGVGIDWWMTNQFQSQLELEMDSFLFRIENTILYGTPPTPGIDPTLQTFLQDLQRLESDLLVSSPNASPRSSSILNP